MYDAEFLSNKHLNSIRYNDSTPKKTWKIKFVAE